MDQRDDVDWLLAWMINFAERGLELGVTLNVGGALITGNLIGGRKYFETLGNLMQNANFTGFEVDPEFKTNMGTNFAMWKDLYPKTEDIKADDVPRPSYIHLARAHIVLKNVPLTSGDGVPLWRGKLSSVDGFTIGTLRFNAS